jgi:hypothetical protein
MLTLNKNKPTKTSVSVTSFSLLLPLVLLCFHVHDVLVFAQEDICTLNQLIADDPSYTCVDGTFNCPAVTVCPVVCMAEGEQCPVELQCQQDAPNLCDDGTCAQDCAFANALAAAEDFESPCPKCRPVIW